MNEKKYILAILIASAGYAFAYNADHGPFPDDAKVNRLTLAELTREADGDQTNSVTNYTFRVPDQKNSRLNLVWKDNLWFVELVVQGEAVLQPTEFSDFGFIAGLTAFSADLNQDRADDFVIYSYSGGCGLACGYCNVAFILSSGEKYTLTTVTTLFPDESDFIIVDKKPYFIHTSFLGVAECKDGRNHNFWIYNLLAFGKDAVKVDNSVHSAFPKTIWYTFKPNHTETSIITDEQKADLRKQSLTCVYWKEEDS